MDNGLVTASSPVGSSETLTRLLAAIEGHGLQIFASIDHAHAAELAGLKLKPASLVIFGSPKAGTPLMHIAPSLAIDLPLKALVWEDDGGGTWLTYNAPSWLARRHRLIGPRETESSRNAPEGAGPVDEGFADEAGPIAGPLLTAMARVLSEIAATVLRPDPAL